MQTRFHYFFDWDPGKAASNFRKHKVTFETAATVFGDPLALSVYDDESSEEERWVTLGRTEKGRLLLVGSHLPGDESDRGTRAHYLGEDPNQA